MPSNRHCQPPVHVRVPLALIANVSPRRAVIGAACACGAQGSAAGGGMSGLEAAARIAPGNRMPPALAADANRKSRRDSAVVSLAGSPVRSDWFIGGLSRLDFANESAMPRACVA